MPCVCVWYVYVCVHVHTCEGTCGPNTNIGRLSPLLPTFFLDRLSQLELELACTASLTGQLSPGISVLPFFQVEELQGGHSCLAFTWIVEVRILVLLLECQGPFPLNHLPSLSHPSLSRENTGV